MKMISVITISFNSKDTIENTILSVINQTAYDHIEFIVIDGGSTDGTNEIIEKYRDNIAVYVSEPDGGIYNAMNKGVGLASGDYIHFLNSNDTYIDHNVVDKVLEVAENYNTDFVIGDVLLSPLRGGEIYRSSRKLSRLTLFIDWIYHVTLFQKKTLFEKYGGFDESFKISADANWFIPLLQDSEITKAYVATPIANFALDGVSAMESTRDETFAELERVLTRHFRGFDDLLRRVLCESSFDKYSPIYVKIIKIIIITTNLKRIIIKFLKKRKTWAIKYKNKTGGYGELN